MKKVRSVSDYTNQEPQLATCEAVPSVTGGLLPDIHQADYATKLQFTLESCALLADESGLDRIALAINPDYEQKVKIGAGTFEGNLSPNSIFSMAGSFAEQNWADNKAVDAYCMAVGLAFEQDAVPYMKAEPNTPENAKLSFGLQIEFDEVLDAEALVIIQGVFAEHAKGVEFTKVDEYAIRAVNFRDEDGLPFAMTDSDFTSSLLKAVEQLPFENAEIQRVRVSGNYICNDWEQHPNGEGYVTSLVESGYGHIAALALEIRKEYMGVIKQFAQKFEMKDATPERSKRDTEFAIG